MNSKHSANRFLYDTLIMGTIVMEYGCHYACLTCRKSFKRNVDLTVDWAEQAIKVCPNCSSNSYNCGRHFKPPQCSDELQWRKVEYLLEHGFWFHHVLDEKEYVPYPKDLKEAQKFVEKYRAQASQEAVNMYQESRLSKPAQRQQ